MKQNIKTIEEIAAEAYQLVNGQRNVLEKTCIAITETRHLGAKQEALRELGWEKVNVHDADTKKESEKLWQEEVVSKSPLAIIVMTTRGEVAQTFVPDFKTFDNWCRTNDIKNEEYWILPLGITHEKLLTSETFDSMSMSGSNSTRYKVKVNINLDGLFKKKQLALEKSASLVFEGVTPIETILTAKGLSLLHTGSNNNLSQSGVVRHFSSFKDVEKMVQLLQKQKCTTILVYLHKVYVTKTVIAKKEDVVES